jgi:Cys-rich protein (TIGR01571 family)
MTDSSAKYTSVSGDGSLPMVTGVAVPSPTTLEVIAPSALPGGYHLNVDLDGRHVVVLVPEGGVKEGQMFKATVLNSEVDGVAKGHSIPTGRWRDDLCDCLKLGVCHAQCWLAWCCPPIALGQVQTRMKYDWSGAPLNGRVTWMSAFKFMLISFIVYYVIDTTLSFMIFPYTTGEFNEETGTYTVPDSIPSWVNVVDAIHNGLSLLYSIFLLVVLVRTRSNIRARYQIPEQSCHGCEDCCCSFWCSPCTICQMARHTADYATYGPSCCTETGLDPRAPEVV